MLRSFDPAADSLRRFASLARRTGLTSENLHAFRTACKKVRYVAEMGAGQRSQAIVASLKRVQDAIGDWHDWDALRTTAEDMFGRSLDSALVMALRNVTQAKFEEARHLALEVRRDLLAEHRALTAARRKAPRRASVRKSLHAINNVA